MIKLTEEYIGIFGIIILIYISFEIIRKLYPIVKKSENMKIQNLEKDIRNLILTMEKLINKIDNQQNHIAKLESKVLVHEALLNQLNNKKKDY